MEKAERFGVQDLSSPVPSPPLPSPITPTHLAHFYHPCRQPLELLAETSTKGLIILSLPYWKIPDLQPQLSYSQQFREQLKFKLQTIRLPNGCPEPRKSSLKPEAHTIWELEGTYKAIWFNHPRNTGIYSAVSWMDDLLVNLCLNILWFPTLPHAASKEHFLLEVLRTTAWKWTALSPPKDTQD